MELKEMIKVMQHFDNGGDIEYSYNNFETVLDKCNKYNSKLCWNWEDFKYRIKGQKEKVTIEKWLLKDDEDNYYVVQTSDIDKFNDDEKVKLIESYEIEL